jgi:hypothetical protein
MRSLALVLAFVAGAFATLQLGIVWCSSQAGLFTARWHYVSNSYAR